MYKEDVVLNNLQWLICHKTQPKQIIYIYNLLRLGFMADQPLEVI